MTLDFGLINIVINIKEKMNWLTIGTSFIETFLIYKFVSLLFNQIHQIQKNHQIQKTHRTHQNRSY